MMEYDKIAGIAADILNLKPEKITEKSSFTSDLGADSLDLFLLTAEIEDAFALSLPRNAFLKNRTVGDIVKLVKSLA